MKTNRAKILRKLNSISNPPCKQLFQAHTQIQNSQTSLDIKEAKMPPPQNADNIDEKSIKPEEKNSTVDLDPSLEKPITPVSNFGEKDVIVLYTTSLRGIRKTFEDCNTVRFLLESFRVLYSERDVSMHMEYRNELWGVLGGRVVPPRLFIRGRYVGGADEVMGLHETGVLRDLLDGIPLSPSNCPCAGCGGMRFVMCVGCNGSRKVVSEKKKNNETLSIRCSECNENGLVKCSVC
ncbi:hypothetical protein CASFOL_030569 [Castilleja foliolosa]|uniref:Glutaredoxin domain-containing protein n=1 Tax=Castilleja foliolosa TaxID=1961234 RepID=A0ABD3C5P0_9LAMI